MSHQQHNKPLSKALNTVLSRIDLLYQQLNDLRDIDQTSIEKALDIEYTYDSNRIEGNTLCLNTRRNRPCY